MDFTFVVEKGSYLIRWGISQIVAIGLRNLNATEKKLSTADIQEIVGIDYFYPMDLEGLTGLQRELFTLFCSAPWVKKKIM